MNHQSEDSSVREMSESIPKIEGDFSQPESVTSIIRMCSNRNSCGSFGGFTLVAALGIGFMAYSATHVYVGFCAPLGLMGFVQSLVIMDSTFCQVLMGIISHSQSLYGAMMVGLLFSIMGGINKSVSSVTGLPEGQIPRTINVRSFQQ
jgi:hypothetical protein